MRPARSPLVALQVRTKRRLSYHGCAVGFAFLCFFSFLFMLLLLFVLKLLLLLFIATAVLLDVAVSHSRICGGLRSIAGLRLRTCRIDGR